MKLVLFMSDGELFSATSKKDGTIEARPSTDALEAIANVREFLEALETELRTLEGKQ